jgi:hypothetical protein
MFFESTLNFDHYGQLIQYPVIGHSNENSIAWVCFQQDGATVHAAYVLMVLLCDVFGEWQVSRDIWSLRFPDRSPSNFYL